MSGMPYPFASERTMSLSFSEFTTSIAKLGPHRLSSDGFPLFELSPSGSVEIRFIPMAPKTLGGLLALPQARVNLVFNEASHEARNAFTTRFDIAFQRGGG